MYIRILITIIALSSLSKGQEIWNIIEEIIEVTSTDISEDARLNITGLATKYGYNIEEHTVTTEDGYILTLHRIHDEKSKRNGPPIFLMHGILESSDSWVLQGPNKSLAYLLADEGFDVWMGNARGNKHSLEHRTLNNQESQYWNFTWEETGVYDLPAIIDYILDKTANKNLYYIGHSQGTTNGYVLLSMKPEYNDKIQIMFSLAPEAFMGNVKSPIIKLFSSIDYLTNWMLEYNPFQLIPDSFSKVLPTVCRLLPSSCDNVMHAISGFENKQNDSIVPVILGHMPTGSSTLQFLHYGQLVNSKRFCRYNHGYSKNIEKYGQDVPPDYDLSNIVAPNILYYSGNDWLSDPSDVIKLRNRLPTVLESIYLENFTHMDYQYGADASELIYLRIIEQIRKFEKESATN